MHGFRRVWPFVLLLLFLGGCFNPDEYLRAPRPAVHIEQLQTQIDAILTGGIQRSVPVTGQYRQAIQFVDMDNSGNDEAVLFVKDAAASLHRIYVFCMRDGQYLELSPIEKNADSIHSVTFRDVDGKGGAELIVGWQLGSLRALSVYALSGNSIIKLLSEKNYTGYEILEAEELPYPALMLIQADPSGQTSSVVEMIQLSGEGEDLLQTKTARLSNGTGNLRRTRTGKLKDGSPALFVTSDFLIEDGNGTTEGEITDVFVYRSDGHFVNVSLQMESGVSDILIRRIRDLAATDINGDGFLDLPRPQLLPRDPRKDESSSLYYQIEWITLDSFGTSETVAHTFHSVARGWYYRFPETWPESFTVSRETVENWDATVIETRFSLLTDDGQRAQDIFIITEYIYKTNTHDVPADEILLSDDSSTCITARVCPLPYYPGYQVTGEELQENFRFVESDWFYLSTLNS